MDTKNKTTVTSEELRAAFEGETKKGDVSKKAPKKSRKIDKWTICKIIGGISCVAGIVCLLVAFLGFSDQKAKLDFPVIPSNSKEQDFSLLTGEPLAKAEQKTAPTYCIQIPNGTDGGRPQVGLNQAGVVFEAVAEAGITRFAAIYQNPSEAIIGPVRSLRIYYLEWDTPFDCTIVHAGGSGDALAAVSNGGYKDLSEDYSYMYRGTYGGRMWNNLFTTSAYLEKFNADHNYKSSDIKGFARLTPDESDTDRANGAASEKLDITKATNKNTSDISVPVPKISLDLGGWADYNINYVYDADSNTYLRSYASGREHQIYNCANEDLGEKNPEDVCTLTQITPSVVVAMVVKESRAADNYHEDISAVGSGDVYVFQNGNAIKGTWEKSSAKDQIKFKDKAGKEIKLAPGQTFVTAVPNYGKITY